jgi:excisionase family DNA binding protein
MAPGPSGGRSFAKPRTTQPSLRRGTPNEAAVGIVVASVGDAILTDGEAYAFLPADTAGRASAGIVVGRCSSRPFRPWWGCSVMSVVHSLRLTRESFANLPVDCDWPMRWLHLFRLLRLNQMTISTTPTTLAPAETKAASAAARLLAGALEENSERREVELRVSEGTSVLVPRAALALIVEVLEQLGGGEGVMVVAERAELSTQQAADLLNVSRPYILKLIDERQLPARKVGTHRRILLGDLLAYKRRDEADRDAVLTELAGIGQEHGI